MMKKVIGILGTTNKEGLTAEMLHTVLDGAAEAGNEVDCIYLADHDVKMNGPVINKISRQIEDADCIVLAAPTYWGGISGLAKNFLDAMRPRFVATTKRGDVKPTRYKNKTYISITSCYKSAFENIVAGVTNGTFNTIDQVFTAAGMHRVGEIVLPGTYHLKQLPTKKREEAKQVGSRIGQKLDRGGFVLKRYVQLFVMLAVSTLIVRGIQVGIEKIGWFNTTNFWVDYAVFVIIFFLFLSIMLHSLTVHNHKRK